MGKDTPASIKREPEQGTSATRWDVAARVALAAGAVTGWLFRQDILLALVAPWASEALWRYVSDGNPSAERLFLWYAEIAAVVGILVALPLLVLAALSVLAPRFASPRTVPMALFLCSSYLAVAAGSLAWALVARPQFVAEQRASWGRFAPLPGAYVDHDLGHLMLFALACQACVLLVLLTKAGRAVRQPS